MDIEKRLIGSYFIFLGGSWFLSFMMKMNGVPDEVFGLYAFLCFVRRILLIPPGVIAGWYALEFLLTAIDDLRSSRKNSHTSRDYNFDHEAFERRMLDDEKREEERIQKNLEEKRARAKRESDRKERERIELESRKTRSAEDATKKALEDFS